MTVDPADDRWSRGEEHYPESVRLIQLINALDTECSLDLQLGGDGDIGESIAYYIDELIYRGKVSITINN